jgi:DNA repair exonuclease SbcCD ATPase subunit
VSELPEVKEKNDATDAELAVIGREEGELRVELASLAGDLRLLESIYAAHCRAEQLAARANGLGLVDRTVVPYRVSYAGPTIPEDGRAGALRLELNTLAVAERQVTMWKARVESAEAAEAAAIEALHDAIDQCQAPEFQDALDRVLGVTRECDDLNREYATAVHEGAQARQRAAALEAHIAAARSVYDAAKARVDSVRGQLAEAKVELDSVIFNNALLKRVRAARPIIANKLWSKVLSTVARYFSLMRGTESSVTKDGDGFKVDGKGIDGLSGSTKDVLGLAIRLALVRVFLPYAPFLILDEPSAACDAQRTASMMGFLVAAGFDQMLVVTHEDTSEQIAASLIEM